MKITTSCEQVCYVSSPNRVFLLVLYNILEICRQTLNLLDIFVIHFALLFTDTHSCKSEIICKGDEIFAFIVAEDANIFFAVKCINSSSIIIYIVTFNQPMSFFS